eukprot:gnl/TRDRNA2_/TRDRNA2_153181_c1_seq1.p1 gnl/TRDRNA2_/TRDRNA2_153181_c1~~gnl/TRDRNA2_/TRDRNA2_153181_c1_seq1.p1  ORF type:complete len:113 (+),score=20.25 gnl/TRDRNA2_/TRDRNA2_153181_c1_seq1:2-340(+)
MDFTNTGSLDWGEFITFMEHPTVRGYLMTLGIEVRDAELFFDILADLSDTGEVDVIAFAEGCLCMKGPAKAMDIQCLAFQVKMIHENQLRFANYLTARLDRIQKSLTGGKES